MLFYTDEPSYSWEDVLNQVNLYLLCSKYVTSLFLHRRAFMGWEDAAPMYIFGGYLTQTPIHTKLGKYFLSISWIHPETAGLSFMFVVLNKTENKRLLFHKFAHISIMSIRITERWVVLLLANPNYLEIDNFVEMKKKRKNCCQNSKQVFPFQ